MTTIAPRVQLNDGNTIPQVGFGVFKVEPAETERVVLAALEAGYRHFDTAAFYGNENGVGRAIAASGVPRDEVFVTTKVWNTDQGRSTTRRAVERSLTRLGLERVDLMLIHWPVPTQDRYVETWLELERAHRDGRCRSIGVSNFLNEHLERLSEESETVPAVTQIELHPAYQRRPEAAYAQEKGIVVEAWGPLGQGKYPLLDRAEITEPAAAHGRSPAQIVLRWHVQKGHVVFPKSTSPSRQLENIAVFDFDLSADEMARIDAMDAGLRGGPDPRTFAG